MAQRAPRLQRAWLTDPDRAQLERKRCCEAVNGTTSSCRAVALATSLVGPALRQVSWNGWVLALLKVWLHQFVQATNSSLKAWEAGVLQPG